MLLVLLKIASEGADAERVPCAEARLQAQVPMVVRRPELANVVAAARSAKVERHPRDASGEGELVEPREVDNAEGRQAERHGEPRDGDALQGPSCGGRSCAQAR